MAAHTHLLYVRELADRSSEANRLLDKLVIIVVPQINPDGFSAQPNPTRGNTWGIDLNRDYMKLEQPEIAGYVQNVILAWAPHLFIDGHNGGSFLYNLNYQCASHNAPDPRITALCDTEIFPAIDKRLGAENFRAWYYQRGDATQWNVGGSEPRIGRNYGAFANSVGILFESPGGQPMETGVRSGLLGYKAVAEWSRANAQRLKELVHRARRETIALGEKPGDSVPLAVRYEAEDRPVDYLIGEGQGENRKIVEVKGAKLMKKPVTTLERPRPYAYVLPREATEAVALLRQHNITVETLREPTELSVAAYTVADVTHAPQYNHAAAASIKVGEVQTIQRTFPAGSFVVRTAQMQGRVAVHCWSRRRPTASSTGTGWTPGFRVRDRRRPPPRIRTTTPRRPRPARAGVAAPARRGDEGPARAADAGPARAAAVRRSPRCPTYRCSRS